MLGPLLEIAAAGWAREFLDVLVPRKVYGMGHSFCMERECGVEPPLWCFNRCCGEIRMSKAKKKVFSVVKAVKENARERVGPVPPERVIPDPKQKAAANPKHKKTLADLLSGEGEEP
jgi:hypothetical protein